MKYLSVCSGIEAATVAWHPLGWQPFAFAEIEKFPSAVLAHHYPHVPNLGDMTKWKDWPDADVDVLVGGTPCQSFSVAGLRKGLADPRGNLALTYLAIADRYQPTWLLWENVPGVLSSSGGRDFGAFLGGLGELGYGFAYRVLDAQYVRVDGFARAVPQRRRRVFVVGHLGDWRRPAAVLFERESLLWDSAPRRQAGERVAPTISARPTGGGGLGTDFDCDGGLIAKTLVSGGHSNNPLDENLLPIAFAHQQGGNVDLHMARDVGLTLQKSQEQAIVFDTTQITSKTCRSNPQPGDPCHTISAGSHAPAIAIGAFFAGQGAKAGSIAYDQEVSPTLKASESGTNRSPSAHVGMAVRRLTPRECERLQGFPDNYTAIPKAADGPRYKALGNSMAVNVMRWLGSRIQLVNSLSHMDAMYQPNGAENGR